MTFAELIKELEAAPIISGSQAIGWLVQIKVNDKVIKEISFPPGTSYQQVVKIAKRKG